MSCCSVSVKRKLTQSTIRLRNVRRYDVFARAAHTCDKAQSYTIFFSFVIYNKYCAKIKSRMNENFAETV